MPNPSNIPQIVVLISHLEQPTQISRFAEMVASVAALYASSADVRGIETTVDKALEAAQDLERRNAVDVFVCTGATAEYLRRHTSQPVLSMRTGGGDLLRALSEARRYSPKVALLSNRHTNADLADMSSLFTLEIHQVPYNTLDQAQRAVETVRQQGYTTVIGSPTVVELAERAGLVGILSLSTDTVRKALDEALAVLHSSRIETAKRRHLDGVLKNIPSGVAALNTEGVVLSANPALSAIFGKQTAELIGRSLQQLCPDIEMAEALSSRARNDNQILKVNKRTVLFSLLPTIENGEQTGFVFTCQETATVLAADHRIRSSIPTGGFPVKYRLDQYLGNSLSSKQLTDLARRYASTNSTVLITGESGTGKELLAQGIHSESRRHHGPFVAINCAAFPETLLESELFGYHEGAFTGSRKGGKPGLIELAHGGSLFLDEIGDMPVSLQSRLLRVLQEREVLRLGATESIRVDIRVIAATHQDLTTHVSEGKFRKDLFYRLNILRLQTIPLRERKEDIESIGKSILYRLLAIADKAHLHERLFSALSPYLLGYPWPGNIRELENFLERTVFAAEDLLAANITEPNKILLQIIPEFKRLNYTKSDEGNVLQAGDLKLATRLNEKQYIEDFVKEFRGDLNAAAKALGISRSTLWRKLRVS